VVCDSSFCIFCSGVAKSNRLYQKQSPITSPQLYLSSSLHQVEHTVGYRSYHECIWLSNHPEVDPSILPTRGQGTTIARAQSQAIHTGAVGYELTCRNLDVQIEAHSK